MVPKLIYIQPNEFRESQDIFKIIDHEQNRTFGYFILNNNKYFLGWQSSDIIKVTFELLEKEKYLLIGVDLKIVVLCSLTGKILLSLGLFSFFKGFDNTSDLTFTIYTELHDIIINKNGLSISQVICHDLEF